MRKVQRDGMAHRDVQQHIGNVLVLRCIALGIHCLTRLLHARTLTHTIDNQCGSDKLELHTVTSQWCAQAMLPHSILGVFD